MPLQQTLKIFVIIIILSVKAKQERHQYLAKTKDINYTFYHQYQYLNPNCLQIIILIEQKGKILSQIISNVQKTTQNLIKLSNLYNSTLNQLAPEQNQTFIFWEQDYTIQKRIIIKTNANQNLKQFAQMLDKINQLRNKYRFFIDLIVEAHCTAINYQEDLKARTQIQFKSSTICQQYFGMKLQEILSIQKLNKQYHRQKQNQQQGTQTQGQQFISEDNVSSYFVGNLQEIADEIARIDYQQDYQLTNAFYKCQIICKKQLKKISFANLNSSYLSKTAQISKPLKIKNKKIQNIKKRYQNQQL